MKFKKNRTSNYTLSNLEFNFFIDLWMNLKETISVRTGLKKYFFGCKNKRSKYGVEKVSIWQHFLLNGKHKHTLF